VVVVLLLGLLLLVVLPQLPRLRVLLSYAWIALLWVLLQVLLLLLVCCLDYESIHWT
jgi:hypothetical protein